MYFNGNDGTGPHYQIGRATSTDGVSWNIDADPLLGLADFVESVTYDGRQFHMWTSDYASPGIWVATSPDGVTWTHPIENNPVIDDGWSATVAFDGTRYEMWFLGDSGTGYATSADGVSWTRSVSPLVGPLPMAVVKEGGSYQAWFNDETWRDIGLATSADGITWVRRGLSLSVGLPGGWDGSNVNRPSVVRDGATWKMWYSGAAYPASGYQIGYATAP
jgi:hypothetical protein